MGYSASHYRVADLPPQKWHGRLWKLAEVKCGFTSLRSGFIGDARFTCRSRLLDDRGLKIRKVKAGDEGTYVCRVQNRFGWQEAEATLTVHGWSVLYFTRHYTFCLMHSVPLLLVHIMERIA